MNWVLPEIKHGIPTKYNYVVLYPENLILGKNFDIGAFTFINANYGVTLEDDVQIGSHCSIYSKNTIDGTKGTVLIKKGTKIGSHSVILPNSIVDGYYKAFSLIKPVEIITYTEALQ